MISILTQYDPRSWLGFEWYVMNKQMKVEGYLVTGV